MKGIRIALGLAALAAGVAAAWATFATDRVGDGDAKAILTILVSWSFIGSGLVTWRRSSANPLGPVMVFIGFAAYATFLDDLRQPVLFTLGVAAANLYLVGFVFLILAFPEGRLRSRLDRALFGSGFVLAVVVQVLLLLFEPSREICDECPRNVFLLSGQPEVAQRILDAQRALGAVASLLTVAVLIDRWRRATAPQRRAAAPVLWAGSTVFVALVLSIANDMSGASYGDATDWLLLIAIATVPLAVLAVVLQRRLARSAVAGLVVELGDLPQRVDLRDAISRALGDPTLELAYWVPSARSYVDSDGRHVELPDIADRAATVVRRAGEPVAALIHDAALGLNPGLVDSVCAAAGLALDNERLQAELRSRLAELRASRARIVEATEDERRRLERDLHDGAQQRLVSISMTLGLLESRLEAGAPTVQTLLVEAREELALALQELRELSQGIRPSALAERGLGTALEELAGRSPVPVHLEVDLGSERRLPDAVESCAYFVASEALANVAKHAHATDATVVVSLRGSTLELEIGDDGIGGAALAAGTGLRGLLDRVEALGGRLLVTSPPGRGTMIRAEIPCG